MNSKRLWPVIRWITFLLVGLMNTVLIKAEDVGSWKNYVGYGFLLLALLDLIWATRKHYHSQGHRHKE